MNKFAMIHTDIHPEWYWLDKLWALINRSKADIITACPALKGEGRYTTVGISSPDMEDPVRWLTFDQLKQLPDPFFIEDIDHKKGEVLCMNTGLWIADITKPWAKIIDWSSIAWIDETKEGLLNPRFVSEDYKVSKVLASHLTTIRIGGTFSIKIDHHGSKPFTNR